MTDLRRYTLATLGIRNNNPGNLRYTPSIKWVGQVGENKGFSVFDTVEHGIRAMAMDLRNDIRKGADTITKLITQYAPPTENDTKAYINRVVRDSSISANTKLSTDDTTLFKLIKAQIAVENGSSASYVTDQMIRDGITLMNGGSISKAVLPIGIFLLILTGIIYFYIRS